LTTDKAKVSYDHVSITLEEVLSEIGKGKSGKILNLLDFPGSTNDKFFPRGLSTDTYALIQTIHHKLGSWIEKYPFSVMRWALVGLEDAIHECHIDAEGFVTAVSVESGEKYWFLAFPPNMDYNKFGSINMFLGSSDSFMENDSDWKILAVKLTPGKTL
jgi:hypothetical protein